MKNVYWKQYDHKQRTLKHRNTQNRSKSTNHKPWPFEPVKVKFCFLRGPLRWLTAAKNAIVSWLLNFRIRMFVKSAVTTKITTLNVSHVGYFSIVAIDFSFPGNTHRESYHLLTRGPDILTAFDQNKGWWLSITSLMKVSWLKPISSCLVQNTPFSIAWLIWHPWQQSIFVIKAGDNWRFLENFWLWA